MNKDDIERAFRAGGTAPTLREKMGEYDLFIADGFSRSPHLSFQRFGIEPDEFPSGMYVTFWWLGRGEKLHIGRPLFFDAADFDSMNKDGRLNSARDDAKRTVKNLKSKAH
jgi:hypothetical protein